ncbi:MAG: hypothetical protein WC718_12015 [Phycisphaerales bacterium]|jgi:uncharacterized Zn finger protein
MVKRTQPQQSAYNSQPPATGNVPAPKVLLHPRRVRGGVKLTGGVVDGPTLWAAQRWLRLAEQVAQGARLGEGLEYAKLGQTKRLANLPGRIEATVQGRADRPYTVTITLDVIPESGWEPVVSSMAEGAIYSAKLLSGELPTNIEDVFAPRGLKLFPTEPSELTVSCTCAEHMAAVQAAKDAPVAPVAPAAPGAAENPSDPLWCKHLCCVAYLMAHRLATEPFLMFSLRGLDGRELLERLRDRRAAAGAPPGDRQPVYVQHVAGVTDNPGAPLEEVVTKFWDSGPELAEVDLPLGPPGVSHPLLRRLGQSPFTAPFPLVGLLASCYDTISQAAREEDAPAADEPALPLDPEETEDN